MSQSRITTWIVAILVLQACPAFAEVYDDGGVHFLNTPFVSPKILGDTTVFVSPPATISFLDAYDSSRVNIGGGEISHFTIHDEAQAFVGGGVISHLEARDSATAAVVGGDISQIRAYDGARITVDGIAGLANVDARGSSDTEGQPATLHSQIDVLGGSYYVATAWAGGVLNLHGGTFSRAGAFTGGTINIFDGAVTEFLGPSSATVNIYGGEFTSLFAAKGAMNLWGGQVREIRDATDDATPGGDVHVFGLSLEYSGVLGDRLKGVLTDGTAIDSPVFLERNRLHLHVVPEPSSASLAFLGLAAIIVRQRRLRRG